MGAAKDGGYIKQQTLTPEQQRLQQYQTQQAQQSAQKAQAGYDQFLPGGEGGQAIIKQAQDRFNQNTVPSITNQFGSGSKTSSALNQALSSGAANLNSDIASQLSQMILQAANGSAGLSGQSQQGAYQPAFAYQQRQKPIWQSAIEAGLGGLGKGLTGGF